MPHLLWPFFSNNWPLLNALFRAATRPMLRWARKLDVKHGVWRDLFFKKHAVEEIWRGAVIRLLRKSYDLVNPASLPGLGHIRDKKQWQRYLQAQYGRYWKVHFAKKTKGRGTRVKYLGRYLKRPPVSASKRRRRGAPLLRPPYAAVPAADTVAGRDDRTLYQPYSGKAF